MRVCARVYVFYWRVVGTQCYVSFRRTAQRLDRLVRYAVLGMSGAAAVPLLHCHSVPAWIRRVLPLGPTLHAFPNGAPASPSPLHPFCHLPPSSPLANIGVFSVFVGPVLLFVYSFFF